MKTPTRTTTTTTKFYVDFHVYGSGTGAWESALTNTLSPGDRIVSFLIGQFSLLWIDQQQRLNFNVDVVESEWGQGANLDVLESKLAVDGAHTIKAICIVHNETATGVTNDLSKVRFLLGKQGRNEEGSRGAIYLPSVHLILRKLYKTLNFQN